MTTSILDDEGSGPAVLLLHGCPGTIEFLKPLVQALAANHRVLTPSLPGYGATPSLPGPYDFEKVTTWLGEEVRRRGISEVAVVGHSLGAYRGIALAVSRAIKVTRLVLLSGFAQVPEEVGRGMKEFARLLRAGTDISPVFLSRMVAPGFSDRRPDAAAEILSWLHAAPNDVIADELDAVGDLPDLLAVLPSLDVPVLARVGALDVATPPAMSEAIVAVARCGRLEVVPACGHAILHEDTTATVASVVDFTR